MIFLHSDTEPIYRYLNDQPNIIFEHELDRRPLVKSYPFLPWLNKRRDARVPQEVTVDEIRAYEIENERPENGGLSPDTYFHVNPPTGGRHVSLSGAAEHVEAYGVPHEFLIWSYNDGGMFSLSRTELPFQSGLEEVTWWRWW